jgi:hypothetical protein
MEPISMNFPQIRSRVNGREVDFGGNIIPLFLHQGANFGGGHSLSGSCSSLPISAENNAPTCRSLTYDQRRA